MLTPQKKGAGGLTTTEGSSDGQSYDLLVNSGCTNF